MLSSSLFVVIAAIVGFFILRAIAKGYFREPHRATVASAAVALTYLILSFPHVSSDSNADRTTPASTSGQVAAAAPGQGQSNLSAACRRGRARISSGAFGSLDAARSGPADIASGESLGADRNLILAGWAGDRATKASARAICMTLDGAIVAAAQTVYGVERPDVASANSAPGLGATGFIVDVPASTLPHGSHVFGIAVETADGTWRSFPKTYTFTII